MRESVDCVMDAAPLFPAAEHGAFASASAAPAKANAVRSARSARSRSALAFSAATISALTRFHGSRSNAHQFEGLRSG
jgi:hypothetical protein